jgi:pimeloyl-ACP methyl ester carboxylesterase/uncharacterized RDD family membrane protein YckC
VEIDMTITADSYINRVLSQLPEATPRREQIATELRGHIAERLAGGQPLDEVLRQLGDPVSLAESYLTAVPLVSAPFLTRAAAKLIDAIVIIGVIAALAAVAFTIGLLVDVEEVGPFILFGAMVGGSFAFVIYTIIAETRRGQTIGKRVMRIRVVRESGARISTGQAVVRQLPMFLQIGFIDVLFALFTEKSQRAFELLSKTRVVLATLTAMLIVAATAQAQARAQATIGQPPGRLWEVGERKLHLHCSGAGAPTVILEAGASSFAIDWSLVQPQIARVTRVCSYDRAGHGWSDGLSTTTAEKVAADLHALLTTAGEKPPLVLVGASMGGIYTRIFERRHPSAVAGLVFIDPSHEDRLFTMLKGQAVSIAELTADQVRETIPVRTQNIPSRPVQIGAPFNLLPPDLYERRLALDRRLIESFPRTMSYEEIVEYQEGQRAALSELRAVRLKIPKPLGSRPVVVLTRGVDTSAAQQEVHASLAALSSNGRHSVIAEAGHEIHLFKPDAVIKAITDVVQSVRTGLPLVNP